MRLRQSLFTRLGAAFLGLLLLLSSVGGVLLHSLIRKDLLETTRRKLLSSSGIFVEDVARMRREVRLYSSLVGGVARMRSEDMGSSEVEAAIVEHSRSRKIRIDEFPVVAGAPPPMEFLKRAWAGVPTLDYVLQGGGSGRLHVVAANPVELRSGDRRVVTASYTLGRDFLLEERAALGGEIAIFLQDELVVSTSTCASCLRCIRDSIFDGKNRPLLESGKTLYFLIDCDPPEAVVAVPMRTHDGRTLIFTINQDRAAEAAALFHATAGVVGGCLLLALLISLLFYRVTLKTRSQIAELTRLAGEISGGRYGEQIPVTGTDEVAELAGAFNRMSVNLRDASAEISEWNRTLEMRVKEKTEELARYHEGMVEVEKLAAIGQLAAGVAHELNNPLAGILGYSELALDLYDGKNASELTAQDMSRILGWFRNIDDLSQRCRAIILDMLKFGRQSSAEFEAVELNDLLGRTLAFIRKQVLEGKVELSLSLAEGLPSIRGNPTQFQQVFTNLFLNAVHAMQGGGTLSVTTSLSGRGVRVEVADTGTGIDPEALKRIFEPFYTTKPVGEGTGLGLSVTYGIVKRHGGEILVRSERGKGTVFTVILPIDGPPPEGSEGTVPA
jgi:signal transduction histidine kinase